MWSGWTGAGLEIDLSRKKIKKSQGDLEMYRKYLGGRGLITRLFWDRVPPEVEPFSPDNILAFGVGALVGTAAPSACRTTMVTKSVVNNYLTDSNMGGFWGPELKFAGYDTLMVSGKATSPVYIFINNDKVEIRDASHLWGKDVFQTQQLIREDLNDDKIQSLCIGPAGENRVYYSDISHSIGCSMSRAGAGAIMGDKKLKAIAVRGNKNINIAKPGPFFDLCREIVSRTPEANTSLTIGQAEGTRYRNAEFSRPWKDSHQDNMDFLINHKAALVGCYNCHMPEIWELQLPEGPIFLKCRTRHRFTSAGDIQDYEFNGRCVSLVQRYGMDSPSIANLCAFAIDLFQKDILTKEDTDGLVLEWGNPEVIPALLTKIAYREGIGDVLANGVYEAARQIGRGAEQYAYHVNKIPPRHNLWEDVKGATRVLICDRLDTGAERNQGPQGYGGLLQELKDPREIERWQDYLTNSSREERKMDLEIDSQLMAYDFDAGAIMDSCGICRHRYDGEPYMSMNRIGFLTELVSYATGVDFSQEEARKCARRVRAISRAHNSILGGIMKAGDMPANFLSEELLADDRALIARMMAEANRIMGFTPEGIPREDALKELGLSDVARELERRGILPEPASIPR